MKSRLRLVLLQLILVSFAGAVVFGQSPASFSGPRAYLGDSAVHRGLHGRWHSRHGRPSTRPPGEIHIHAGLGNGKFAGDEVFEINTAGAGGRKFLYGHSGSEWAMGWRIWSLAFEARPTSL